MSVEKASGFSFKRRRLLEVLKARDPRPFIQDMALGARDPLVASVILMASAVNAGVARSETVALGVVCLLVTHVFTRSNRRRSIIST